MPFNLIVFPLSASVSFGSQLALSVSVVNSRLTRIVLVLLFLHEFDKTRNLRFYTICLFSNLRGGGGGKGEEKERKKENKRRENVWVNIILYELEFNGEALQTRRNKTK